jgi:hypothetical protein
MKLSVRFERPSVLREYLNTCYRSFEKPGSDTMKEDPIETSSISF